MLFFLISATNKKKVFLCVFHHQEAIKKIFFCEWRTFQLVHSFFFFNSIIILRSYTMPLISFLKWIIKIPSVLYATYVSHSLRFFLQSRNEMNWSTYTSWERNTNMNWGCFGIDQWWLKNSFTGNLFQKKTFINFILFFWQLCMRNFA